MSALVLLPVLMRLVLMSVVVFMAVPFVRLAGMANSLGVTLMAAGCRPAGNR
ncbi:MAG: hypothetical protein AB8G14_15725 [Ilumatobacter sp.]